MRALHRLRIGLLAIAVSAGAIALTTSDRPGDEPVAAPFGRTQLLSGAQDGERAFAAPVRVRIPTIGVDSPLLQLDVDTAGVLVPPQDFGLAGWYRGGTVPGAVGPAVIAGHVDSSTGPAVFFRLDELAADAEILVDRADGTTIAFTVQATDRYPKDTFPTEEVYRPTPRVELRLITCGGTFDQQRRSYRDNVVVTAVAR